MTSTIAISSTSTVDDTNSWSSSAGDVNGDGMDDLIVNTWNGDADGNYTGATYVVFGTADGSANTIDVATLDGHNGFKLSGGPGIDDSSVSASQAGDINGDGFADLIVTGYSYDSNGNSTGSTHVVFGSAAATAPRWTLPRSMATTASTSPTVPSMMAAAFPLRWTVTSTATASTI